MQHLNKTELQHTFKKQMKHWEQMLATCCKKPLQHMQHLNLPLQHPYENSCNIPLKHMVATHVFSAQHGADGATN
jgi:hypothetical protein